MDKSHTIKTRLDQALSDALDRTTDRTLVILEEEVRRVATVHPDSDVQLACQRLADRIARLNQQETLDVARALTELTSYCINQWRS